EDEVRPEQEAASLRLPPYQVREAGADRGPVIGIRRATRPEDLSVVGTLLEAAKFQPVRRRFVPDASGRLLLSPAGLRSYRRAPVPESLLLLLLDYTSLRGCEWESALLPHLSWAYAARARVGLIQVGAAGAADLLRADRILAPSLLVPRLVSAFEDGPGRA